MLRIAIAGAPSPNYQAALAAQGMEPVDTLELRDTEGFDGLVLPGGGDIDPGLYGQENRASVNPDRALDEAQLRLCGLFVAARKPILGICKGHQLLNTYFGGTLCQHIPEEPRHGWNQGDRVHETVCREDCFLAGLYGTRFPTNSAHHQAVDRIAEGFLPVQYAEDGVLESMVHQSLPIVSVQWHPERMCGAKRRDDTVDGAPLFAYFKRLAEGAER